MKFSLYLLLYFFLASAFAVEEKPAKEFNFSLGMAIINWKETATSISGVGNVDQVQSGSTSVICAKVSYDVNTNYSNKWVFELIAPLISSDGQSYFSGGLSWQYFFNKRSGGLKIETESKVITVDEKFKYYVGADIAGAYMAYLTETAKKQDTFIEFGPSAGMHYKIRENLKLNSEAKISRGVGSATSSLGFKLFLGVRYFYGF
jgi:hypothetical protein